MDKSKSKVIKKIAAQKGLKVIDLKLHPELEELSKVDLVLFAEKEFGLELKPYQTKKSMITQITTAKLHKEVHDSIARRARVNDVSVRHLPDDDG